MAHFEAWGGTIPSTPETVAEYLAGLSAAHSNNGGRRDAAHNPSGENNGCENHSDPRETPAR
jgi:hypothetical protein